MNFDEEFLKKLEMLHIISRKIASGQMRAERRTKKIGSGIEFADHRNYVAGDDTRNLDWNVYLRTRKLLLRLFEEEEDLYIYLLVDSSASMGLGLEGKTKFEYAKAIAAALGYVGLANLDRVSVIPFNSKLTDRLPPSRGRGQIYKIFKFLNKMEVGGQTSTADAFKSFIAQNKRRGVVVVLSDFYDPDGFIDGLNYLRYNKFEAIAVQLYDETELNPALRGELEVVDCETGEVQSITVTAGLLKEYRAAFDAFSKEIEDFCGKRNMLYLKSSIQTPFDELIMRVFRAGAFLK